MESFKTLIVSILNTIHQKLKTKEGQLSLIIVGSLITGSSIVTANLKGERIDELEKDRISLEKEILVYKAEVKQLNKEIKEIDETCNERAIKNAKFQKELNDIYQLKTVENTDIVNEKLDLLKEKQKAIKNQKEALDEIKKLNHKL